MIGFCVASHTIRMHHGFPCGDGEGKETRGPHVTSPGHPGSFLLTETKPVSKEAPHPAEPGPENCQRSHRASCRIRLHGESQGLGFATSSGLNWDMTPWLNLYPLGETCLSLSFPICEVGAETPALW